EKDVPVLIVPVEAVINFAGVTKVFVIEGGVARVREVQVGRIKDGKQQIFTGLKAGDSVVVTGHGKLRDGLKVTVKHAADSAPPASQ
ncbi:MAG: efflux RND transporter periplasmic adaptor subunit, partial [Verrucomicrobia bacterium]|nr:efflux RND transporter periplasmic adaptor subunit [Verrucomicrobiota bacterium]